MDWKEKLEIHSLVHITVALFGRLLLRPITNLSLLVSSFVFCT